MLSRQTIWKIDRRLIAIGIGLLVGLGGGILALVLVLAGPIMTFGAVFALIAGLIALSNLDAALILLISTACLLPYGTLPFEIAITPSLIDMALATVLTVYIFQWMTGQRFDLRTTPVHLVVVVFILILLAAFILGIPNGPLTSSVLRRFTAMIGSVILGLLLVDMVRTRITLRRLAGTFMIMGATAGAIGIVLWVLDDFLAESMLNRLGRIGYPVGGVLHYRQDNVEIGIERAIGTWIDPNAYGGFLLMIGALTAPQLFAKKPLFRYREVSFLLMGLIAGGLFLSNSRGSMLGLAAAVGLIALLHYRRLLWLMIPGGILFLFLPQTQDLVQRFISGFQGADLETQMRFGEFKDAIDLINRNPIIGVGFISAPDIDLYIGVSNTYLTIASNMGLVGLAAYLITISSVFLYAYSGRQAAIADDSVVDIWFGLQAGIVGALIGGIFDHFYFNVDFQAIALIFWIFVGLILAATRMVNQPILSEFNYTE